MAQPPHHPATDHWKRALARFLDTRAYTRDEWQLRAVGAHHTSLIAAVQHFLERLREQETQVALLERDILTEDWDTWLEQQFGQEAAVLREADPAAVAYGIRWCEILLNRQWDVEQLLASPPVAVMMWTHDLA